MTLTSRAGSDSRPEARRRPDPGGFTLVELLVAMTLVVVLGALLVPMLAPAPGRVLRTTASEVATTLREARRLARSAQSAQRFVLDMRSGRFGVEHAPGWRSLPEDVSATLTTAESLLGASGRGAIAFYPDGSSSGGRVTLEMAGLAQQVDIEWLTGRIRVRDHTP